MVHAQADVREIAELEVETMVVTRSKGPVTDNLLMWIHPTSLHDELDAPWPKVALPTSADTVATSVSVPLQAS